MKTKLLIPLFLLLGSFIIIVNAQTDLSQHFAPKKGYIHLKNGTVLKGKYIYSPDFDKIRVITSTESRVFDASEVEKISTKSPKSEAKSAEPSDSFSPYRFFSYNEWGILVGNSDNNVKTPVMFHTSFNYTVLPDFSIGVGTGVEIYNETYLPVFANLMYKFSGDKRISPYVMLQGGYEIPIEGTRMKYADIGIPSWNSIWYPTQTLDMKAKGGFLIGPSVGFTYRMSEGFAMGLSVGYRHHSLRYTADDDYSMRVNYNRLSIKLGFIFN